MREHIAEPASATRAAQAPIVDHDDLRHTVIEAVTFHDHASTTPTAFRGPLADLIKPHTESRAKTGSPAFSPIVCRTGAKRGDDGVERVTALVFNLNKITPAQWDAVRAKLNPYAHVWFTTWTHGERSGTGQGRFGVLVLISRPIEPSDFHHVWSVAGQELCLGVHDRTGSRPTCKYPLPSAPSHRLPLAEGPIWHNGARYDVDRALKAEAPTARARPYKAPPHQRDSLNAAEIAAALDGVKQGAGWRAHCPAHDDQRSSLSINEENGKVLGEIRDISSLLTKSGFPAKISVIRDSASRTMTSFCAGSPNPTLNIVASVPLTVAFVASILYVFIFRTLQGNSYLYF